MISQGIQDNSCEITRQVAHFKINDDLTVNKIYDPSPKQPQKEENENASNDKADP